MMNTSKINPFAIGDIVYIIGKYMPDSSSPTVLLKCKISHIKHRQFIAYRVDGGPGEWPFSKKHYNKCVFKDENKAIKQFNEEKI